MYMVFLGVKTKLLKVIGGRCKVVQTCVQILIAEVSEQFTNILDFE
jgi:hypothetical protein